MENKPMKSSTSYIIGELQIKTLKQSRCPSAGEWIKKLWSIQTREYYSAPNRDECSSHEKTQRSITCISLSERSQSRKATHGMIPTI